MEQHLQQQIAEFLLDGLGVLVLNGVEQLVGLLEQVRAQRIVGLGGFPAAEMPQPIHHLDGLGEPGREGGGIGLHAQRVGHRT